MATQKVVVAYIPVLHRGYWRLLEQAKGANLYILGPEIIDQFRSLVKDLRALEPQAVAEAVQAWGLASNVTVATPADLKLLAKSNCAITMPDEDVSHALATQYFAARDVSYDPIFLRWDRSKSETKTQPTPDHHISTAQRDQRLMLAAAKAAKQSSDIWRQVGALLAKDGQPIITAYNHSLPTSNTAWTDGDPRNNYSKGVAIETSIFIHAESALIAEAARRGIALADADIYVTTFPCPVCAKLIAASGLARCYFASGYAMLDGQQVLQSAGVELIQIVQGPDTKSDPLGVPYPE